MSGTIVGTDDTKQSPRPPWSSYDSERNSKQRNKQINNVYPEGLTFGKQNIRMIQSNVS